MGFILDAVIQLDIVGSRDNITIDYENINISGYSQSVDASKTEQGFLVSFTYANGVTPNIEFKVEGSADNISFAPIPGGSRAVTDVSGYAVFDFINNNANYVRLSWTVAAGSVDIYAHFSGKRRH